MVPCQLLRVSDVRLTRNTQHVSTAPCPLIKMIKIIIFQYCLIIYFTGNNMKCHSDFIYKKKLNEYQARSSINPHVLMQHSSKGHFLKYILRKIQLWSFFLASLFVLYVVLWYLWESGVSPTSVFLRSAFAPKRKQKMKITSKIVERGTVSQIWCDNIDNYR